MNLSDAKICTFDLETTGTDVATDRIIQCSFSLTQGGKVIGGFDSLLNPERLIPPEVTKLTGIQQDHVAGGPKFRDIIPLIVEHIAACDIIAGFNIVRFDIALLCEELAWAGHDYQFLLDKPVYDAGMVFTKLEPRTLAAAMQFYCGRELVNAHDASADVDATQAVLWAQAERYKLSAKTLDELDKLSRFDDQRTPDPAGKLKYDAEGRVCFNTFRNRGVPVANEVGYARWMLENGFPESTKAVIRRVLDEASAPIRNIFNAAAQLEETANADTDEIPF